MINKILGDVRKSKGFLTKEGSLINYEEVHALGLGVIDGFGMASQGYRLDYWLETHDDVNQGTMHYYSFGYNFARSVKYLVILSVLYYFLGVDALKLLIS